jgi:hypothetical protein
MPKVEFEATIGAHGELVPVGALATRATVRLQAYKGRQALVTVEPERKRRSLAQNARYWGCIVPFAAEVLSVTRDVPLSKDQAHHVLKAAFIGVEETALGPVPKSTRDLSTAEFAEYCAKVEGHFASLGQYLPQEWSE